MSVRRHSVLAPVIEECRWIYCVREFTVSVEVYTRSSQDERWRKSGYLEFTGHCWSGVKKMARRGGFLLEPAKPSRRVS